jgi:uncharacterized protein
MVYEAPPPNIFWKCERCTACCRWPGDVKIEDGDVSAISAFLGIGEDEFLSRYTRLRINRQGLSIIEQADDSCVFLEGNDCRINPVKPQQCRDFPNKWNFPGWRQVCHAIPVPVNSEGADSQGNFNSCLNSRKTVNS